jgi:glycosidase
MLSNRISSIIICLILININIQPQTKTPDWAFDKTIYEVNLRQYSEEGNFESFRKHLPELKKLGAGILWFMPIHPIGEVNRKGKLGSYYSVKNYLEVNPEFGTIEDFKKLVKEIHSLGMYVIIDWVANHTA